MGLPRVEDPTEPVALDVITYELFLGRIHASMSMMLLYYDFLLTLAREVRLIWHRPTVTTVTLLFLRYFSLLCYIPMTVALYSLHWSNETCDRFLKFTMTYEILSTLCCTLILTLRIHALFNNKWASAFIGSGFILINILSVMGWTDGHRHDAVTPSPIPVGCVLRVQGYFTENLLFRSWAARCAFDIVVILMTIARTWYIQGFLLNLKVPIARLLTRDGVLYFIAVFASEWGNFMFHTFAVTINQLISNTLIVSALSRLVFNLREEMFHKEMTLTSPDTYLKAVGVDATGFAKNNTSSDASSSTAGVTFLVDDDLGERREHRGRARELRSTTTGTSGGFTVGTIYEVNEEDSFALTSMGGRSEYSDVRRIDMHSA